jgi:hypothetical protein
LTKAELVSSLNLINPNKIYKIVKLGIACKDILLARSLRPKVACRTHLPTYTDVGPKHLTYPTRKASKKVYRTGEVKCLKNLLAAVTRELPALTELSTCSK